MIESNVLITIRSVAHTKMKTADSISYYTCMPNKLVSAIEALSVTTNKQRRNGGFIR